MADEHTQKKEIGFVISAQDYLIYIEGLPNAKVNQIVVTKNGSRALVSALDKNRVEVLMLDPERPRPGDYFETSDAGLTLPLHANIFGRAFNPIGVPIDGKQPLPPGGELIDLEMEAPGIEGRELITKQFYTGMTAIDTLVPVGRGQRELIMGEARAGEPPFYLDVIMSQKTQNTICVYAAIGKSEIEVRRFAESVNAAGGDSYTIIVAATSTESAPMIQICPAVAISVAEYFARKGRNVLCILDDLGTHAKYLREITLLAGRTPGRESYPADIFYQHSHLLERGGNFNSLYGSGSITMLPVVETVADSTSTLIPTNIMSITDGHIQFSAGLYATGTYPAIEVDKSVTRCGRQTQIFIHKVLSDKVRSIMADYVEMEKFSKFGSELTPETLTTIKRGKVLVEFLKQRPLSPIPWELQIPLLGLVFTGVFDKVELEVVSKEKPAILDFLSKEPRVTSLFPSYKTLKFNELVEVLKSLAPNIEKLCQQSVT